MKKPVQVQNSMPSWAEIVPMMYDKGLDGWQDEVVRVIYNSEQTGRFVILKNRHGCYRYVLEILHPFDEDEWSCIGSQPGALPAMWRTADTGGVSLFSDMDEALKAVKATPEYMAFFCRKQP